MAMIVYLKKLKGDDNLVKWTEIIIFYFLESIHVVSKIDT